jgi:hypothetical protein
VDESILFRTKQVSIISETYTRSNRS